MKTLHSEAISKHEGVWCVLLRRVLVPLGVLFEGGELLLLILFIVLYCLGK